MIVTALVGAPTSDIHGTLISLAMMALVALLIAREIVDSFGGPRSVRWRRALHVAIVPLLVLCAVVVAEKLAHAL
jgi:hypothetical protein